jgi:release factor glutamine methyltransferase
MALPMPSLTIAEHEIRMRDRLKSISDTARLDGQVLLAHVTGRSKAWVLAHPEQQLSEIQEDQLQKALARLENGEPLPYVLGRWEFYTLNFKVSAPVLIPRPETELLVDYALEWLQARPECRRVIDVGTGSGCIAITLAVKIPDVHVLATDASAAALVVARENSRLHHVDQCITFTHADLLPGTEHSSAHRSGRVDVLCANLPYIPSHELQSLPVSRWEPHAALDGGVDGLQVIHRLLQLAPDWMAQNGLVLLEIGADQGAKVRGMAQVAFPAARIELLADLTGRDRLIAIHLES